MQTDRQNSTTRSKKASQAIKTESDDFVSVARRLGCDEDKEHFEAKLATIAKPIMESKGDIEAVIGSFNDRSPVPKKVRSTMHDNSQALAAITMKSPC
jgi:hypothetical protein